MMFVVKKVFHYYLHSKVPHEMFLIPFHRLCIVLTNLDVQNTFQAAFCLENSG